MTSLTVKSIRQDDPTDSPGGRGSMPGDWKPEEEFYY